MNKTSYPFSNAGFAAVCMIALTGCTTYIEEAPPGTAYAAPPSPPIEQPAPAVIYASPPVAQPAPPSAEASVEVAIQTENDFVEPLAPYGEWVVVGSYGRCWRPVRVDAGWRPYCNGYWQRTDAGWFWATDEPWGWATYHYGRWDWTANFGWIWVPQMQWAPSWVAWREGAGYVGWAPLPPTATFAISGGVVFRDAAFAPRAFVFVEERRLLEPVRPRTVIVNNTIVINKTVNITKIQVVNKIVVNEGPRPDVIERASGRRVQTVAVRDLRHKAEAEVITRHSALQRTVRPAATAEKAVQQPGRTGPEPAKGVLPRQQPPVERAVEKPRLPDAGFVRTQPEVKPEAKPQVLPRETRQVEKPAEAVKDPHPLPVRSNDREMDARKPSTPAQLETQRPIRNEGIPEVKRGAERPASVKPPIKPGQKQVEIQSKPVKGKSGEHSEPKVKESDPKEKKGEPSEAPR